MAATQADALGTVLVIGGCGFLGSKLVRMLLEEPSVSLVHVISRNPTKNLNPKAVYHSGDISNSAEVSTLITDIKANVIFHCASPKYNEPERILHSTNVVGTEVLLKAASTSPSTKAFIYTSSQFAVVPTPFSTLTEDKATIHTEKTWNNAYSKSKALAEKAVLATNGADLRTLVLRLPCIYGKDDDNFMGSFMQTLKKGQHKSQVGKNEKVFEFLYDEKACEAHILAAKALISSDSSKGKVDGEAFFLSDEQKIPFFDFARKVYEYAGHHVPKDQIQVVPYWVVMTFAMLGEWLYKIFTLGSKQPELTKLSIQILDMGANWDISKAKQRLGFKPISDFDGNLKMVAEYEYERSTTVDKEAGTALK